MPVVVVFSHCSKESLGTDAIALDVAEAAEISLRILRAPQTGKVGPLDELDPEGRLE